MSGRSYSEEQIDAAIEALTDPDRFSEAEALVAEAAPKLQRVLAQAMQAGGWFGEAHEAEVLKAATIPDQDGRVTAVRTLLAEETRMSMLVGVAVGWALSEELALATTDEVERKSRHGGRGSSGNNPRRPQADAESDSGRKRSNQAASSQANLPVTGNPAKANAKRSISRE